MFQSKSHLRKAGQEKGQATVESVLLIAVTVIIAISLMFTFYQPLNKWLDNYMGSYLTCLIDVGELPNLGSGNEGQCDAEYEKFTLGEGRPPTPGSGGSSSSGSNDRDNDGRQRSGSSGSENGGGSGPAGRRISQSQTRGFPTNGTGADGAASSKESRQEVPEELSQTTYFRAQTKITVEAQGRVKRIPATGVTGLLKEEKEKREREAARTQTVDVGSDTQSTKSKKFIVKQPERKIAAEEEDEPWNIGRIMRWALIILLILAILMFIGGQVLQITKSMEK